MIECKIKAKHIASDHQCMAWKVEIKGEFTDAKFKKLMEVLQK